MTNDKEPSAAPSRPVMLAIGMLTVAYLVAAILGLPQAGTRMILEASSHASGHPVLAEAPLEDPHSGLIPPHLITVLPFVGLLGAIAVLPLVPAASHWWEHNRNKFVVALTLAAVTLLYYLLAHRHAIERHFLGHAFVEPGEGAFSFGLAWTVFQNAIFGEFVPFIILLFSLYAISGGVRIQGDLPAHPGTNTAFLGVGALAASIVGTTGAAMLLIRPLLETNRERRKVVHTVVFFIFAVCNCGGCLLPIGDPPLFLGYLAGVDFLWTLNLWLPWLMVNGLLLATYYAWDRFVAYPSEAASDVRRDQRQRTPLRVVGLGLNGALLAGVILSVALLDPGKPLPGTDWHAPLFLREIVQLLLVVISLAAGSQAVRVANHFNYAAIAEVAALFVGIFICMQPALQILAIRGPDLGIDSPVQFFWATGALSSVLDNAPTYLVFFQTAQTLSAPGETTVAGVTESRLAAVSLGAVFLGAMTYIGNGPNFMVKAIAESAGVRMPGFFGYLLYSCLVLLPLFALVSLVCLGGG